MVILRFDWPSRDLSPNRHIRWQAKNNPRAQAKRDAYIIAKACGKKAPDGDLHAYLMFCPPDKRKRDLDNLLASMKPSIDGACEALSIDDSRIKEISVKWGAITKNGAVLMELWAINQIQEALK